MSQKTLSLKHNYKNVANNIKSCKNSIEQWKKWKNKNKNKNELCKTLTFSKHIYIEDKLILNNKLNNPFFENKFGESLERH